MFEVLAKETTIKIYVVSGPYLSNYTLQNCWTFCRVSKDVPIVQRKGQFFIMLNYGSFSAFLQIWF